MIVAAEGDRYRRGSVTLTSTGTMRSKVTTFCAASEGDEVFPFCPIRNPCYKFNKLNTWMTMECILLHFNQKNNKIIVSLQRSRYW